LRAEDTSKSTQTEKNALKRARFMTFICAERLHLSTLEVYDLR